MCVCVHLVALIVSDSLWSYVLWPTRLLCPWNSPGKNTAVGCHALPPSRDLPDPGIELGSPALLLNHGGSPIYTYAAAAKSLQSCPTLCDPIDSSPPGCPIPGILQARTLELVAISFSCMKVKSESKVAQSCPTLSDPMDCSLPGSSVHGIFQARVLEWGAIDC